MQRDINSMFNTMGMGTFGGGLGRAWEPSLFAPSLGALADVGQPSTALSLLPGVSGVTDVALPSDITRDLAFVPRIDIHEEGNDLIVKAELPGINKEDLKVEYDNGVLRLCGERKREVEQKGENWFRQERSFGRFHRAFRLPYPVKQDAIEAKFQNGVLHVKVPQEKPETHKGKPINVE